MPRSCALLLILVAALAAPACKRDAPAGGQRYPLKGKVVEVDPARRKVTIAHEDIPGFMPAMTMPSGIRKDAALLRGGAGDEVTATLARTRVTGLRTWSS
jgi:protein SCO1/2